VADQGDPSFATTLAHGLDVLAAFRSGSGSLSNADLAGSTGLSRPTVSRLTHTLAQLGYLKRDARGRFELGLGILAPQHRRVQSLTHRASCCRSSPAADLGQNGSRTGAGMQLPARRD